MPINLSSLNHSLSYLQSVHPKLDGLPNEVGIKIVELLDNLRDVGALEITNKRCQEYTHHYWKVYFENKKQGLEFMESKIQCAQPFWLPELRNCVTFRAAPKGCRIQAIEELFRSQPTSRTSRREIINALEQTQLFCDTEIKSLKSLPAEQLLYFTFSKVIMPMVKGRRIDIPVCVKLLKKELEERNREDLKNLLNSSNKHLKPLLSSEQILYLDALQEKKRRFLLTDEAIVTFLLAPKVDLSKFSQLPDEYFEEDIKNIYLHALDKGEAGEFEAGLMRACGLILPMADANGYTALHHTLNESIVDNDRLSHLLENGAGGSINDRVGEEGFTTLHLAVSNKSFSFPKEAVEKTFDLLVRFGAQCLKDFEGNSPLHYAVSWRESNGLAALVKHFPKEVKSLNSAAQTPLHLAALTTPDYWGGIRALAAASKEVINAKDRYGRTAMWYAVDKRFYQGVKELSKQGADPITSSI